MTVLQVRHVRRVARERRDAVAEAQELLTDVEVLQDGIGYPSLCGRYAGHGVRIELIVDAVTMRQLPRLWLAVTLKRRLPIRVPVDIVMRPQPTDIVSPGLRFPYEHQRPAAWPEHVRIATPEPGPLPWSDDDGVLASLLHEPTTKNVILAPGGVRIVSELARGDVASYRVVRRSNFEFGLDSARVQELLDVALKLADGVDRDTACAGVVA